MHHLATPVISDKITGHVNTSFTCQVNALQAGVKYRVGHGRGRIGKGWRWKLNS